MILYVVIEIIIKTLNIEMLELPQDVKCVEKVVVWKFETDIAKKYSNPGYGKNQMQSYKSQNLK